MSKNTTAVYCKNLSKNSTTLQLIQSCLRIPSHYSVFKAVQEYHHILAYTKLSKKTTTIKCIQNCLKRPPQYMQYIHNCLRRPPQYSIYKAVKEYHHNIVYIKLPKNTTTVQCIQSCPRIPPQLSVYKNCPLQVNTVDGGTFSGLPR